MIHCGVVGNIQAFHVWAPGSIPGDGTFLFNERGEGRKFLYKREERKRGGEEEDDDDIIKATKKENVRKKEEEERL